MDAIVRTYAPQDVVIIINGYNLSGWDSISLKFATSHFKTIRGTRSDIRRMKSQSNFASLFVDLSQNSTDNNVLSTLFNTDFNTTVAPADVMLKDTYGGTIVHSTYGYVVGLPEIVYKGEAGVRRWQIDMLYVSEMNVKGGGSQRGDMLSGAIGFVQGLMS